MYGCLSFLLRLSGYPRLIQDPVGPYRVGMRRTRLPDSLYCECMYPIATPDGKHEPYFRPEAISGLAEYAQLPRDLLHHALSRPHPCPFRVPPLEGSWPIVVLVHGLGGCAEMYSQFCMFVASFGYIVVAIEHEDGSGCHAETSDGRTLRYTRLPAGFISSRESILDFRKPFLEQRAAELRTVMLALAKGGGDDLAEVLSVADRANGISLIGHSFGSATILQFLRPTGAPPAQSTPRVRDVVLLDPWLVPVSDAVLAQGISQPTLCILSEQWRNDEEQMLHVRPMLQRCSVLHAAMWATGTVHQSISDSSTWAPAFVSKAMRALGRLEQRDDTRLACAFACHEFFAKPQLAGHRNTARPPKPHLTIPNVLLPLSS
ncbi:hypothetical protein AB1Y20_005491 [Prymnesium parvum]|uniref:1-alkyl-2-acetylglycerophosphocholine esterase n=1 Tax=Prymnesium parvum TaxID=97485 RepID=A0AB34J4C3_PRYPA